MPKPKPNPNPNQVSEMRSAAALLQRLQRRDLYRFVGAVQLITALTLALALTLTLTLTLTPNPSPNPNLYRFVGTLPCSSLGP